MPVQGSKGLYGGYINSRDRSRKHKSQSILDTNNQLLNISNAYKFQEFVSNRENRDTEGEAQNVANEAIVENQEAVKDLYAQGLEEKQSASEVNEAKNNMWLDNEKQIRNSFSQDLKYKYQLAKMDMTTQQNEILSGVSQFIEEQGGWKNITEETYGSMYNHIITAMAGEGGDTDATAEHLEETFGITAQFTPKTASLLAQTTSLAEHDSATGRQEHMYKTKAQLDAYYGKGDDPYKVKTDPAKYQEDAENYQRKAAIALAAGDQDLARSYYELSESLLNTRSNILKGEQGTAIASEIEFGENLIKGISGASTAMMSGDYDPETLNSVLKAVKLAETVHPNATRQEIKEMIWRDYKWDSVMLGKGTLVPKAYQELGESLATEETIVQFKKMQDAISPVIAQMPQEEAAFMIEYLNEEAIRLGIKKFQPELPFEELEPTLSGFVPDAS